MFDSVPPNESLADAGGFKWAMLRFFCAGEGGAAVASFAGEDGTAAASPPLFARAEFSARGVAEFDEPPASSVDATIEAVRLNLRMPADGGGGFVVVSDFGPFASAMVTSAPTPGSLCLLL